MIHCPHPPTLHDREGRCAVRCCECEILAVLVRCACPYNDCRTLVLTEGEVCAACGPCVTAYEMDRP